MIHHRSQDELVQAHADRILADERATAAFMSHLEQQMLSDDGAEHRHRLGGSLRRALRAACRAVLRALTAPAGISESVVGITPDRDDAGDAPPTPPVPPPPPPQYPEGWPWPW